MPNIDVNGQTIDYPDTGDPNWGDNATNFAIQTSAALGKIGLSSGTSVDITQTLDVTGNTTLDANLSVGGNASITGNLTVNGNTQLGNANTDSIGVTGIVNVDSGVLYIDPVGRVGINDTTPSQALDVTGNVAITGNETVGGTLGVIGNTTLTGALLNSNGSVSSPSVSFSADSDNGLYYIGTNNFGISVGGSKIGEFNSNGFQGLDNYALFNEEQPSGTGGGTFTSGAWRTRALNTDKTNRITGLSRSTNTLSFPAGSYKCMAWGVAYRVGRHTIRLYNVTDALTLIDGTSSYALASDGQSISFLYGEFVLLSTKNIELQAQCQSTFATTGFGLNMGGTFTVNKEIYSQIVIWKIA